MKPVRTFFEKLFSQDRRKAARYLAPRLVAYYSEGATAEAHALRDISLAGCYLLTEKRWYSGTTLVMTLQEAGASTYAGAGSSIAVQAKVVRCGDDGVGLKFVFAESENLREELGLVNAADQKALAEFVRRYRGGLNRQT